MQTVILALGKPERISVGRLSPEEKGELLLKESLDLDAGVGGRSLSELTDYLEEFGVVFDTLEDFEGPGIWGLDPEEIKARAVTLRFIPPERGNFLLFKRFLISDEEFAARFIFPFAQKEFRAEALIPLVFDFEEFCGAESLLVGFFYLHEGEIAETLEVLRRELKRVPPSRQPRFLKELEAALLEGRLPHGPALPSRLTFHPALPMEAEFEEHYEAQVFEARPGEVECFSLEIEAEKPIIEG